MKNCPNCGTPMMRGWCPNCHPNPDQMGAYKWYMGGQALQSRLRHHANRLRRHPDDHPSLALRDILTAILEGSS